ncbi:hypothetical protein FB451DRAFT_1559023 [Mycena latifolia]|nr:hypothetical protein FB451DRAFT_1559023 [Mycena latifolia]
MRAYRRIDPLLQPAPPRPASSHPSSRVMDAFTYTVAWNLKAEETVLPPVNEDSGTGSSGSCVVCREDTELPPVNDDSGTGSSGSCVIA